MGWKAWIVFISILFICISCSVRSNNKEFDKLEEAYDEGANYGYDLAVKDIMKVVEVCDEIEMTDEYNMTITLIAKECNVVIEDG